ncbi:N-acetylmuramoyl-L-alanine amidase [Shouchella clausii]|uniref:peptidoglycan recognition protein family protein n=1 Tax=Shouchella clausii TaxID=79880 RepID=UPI002E22507B|nr:N-acetylmuramoyl-L-alanine amidase [Shouchella clausii]MED4176992.1 N-acetylmuramoyl-L-alanine amidase [Shouchella clausii]
MAKKPTIKNAGLTFRGSLTPLAKSKVKKIVQHHMAHQTWDIHDVHKFHRDSNGWAGIGYNFWIGFDGTIYQGRGFNVGAHVGGHNSYTLGVGYQGDFTKQKMTDAQLQAGAALNAWLLAECSIKVPDIIGHNVLAATACPGKNFRMTELRNLVSGGKVSEPKPTNPNGDAFIRQVQEWCCNYGYKVVVDGLKGPKTHQALVKVYQNELNKQFGAGLSVDGIPGSKTYAAARNVRKGAKGNLTRVLQALLYLAGFNPGPFDGHFGDGTEKAVRTFQKSIGLSVDGIAGKATWKALL